MDPSAAVGARDVSVVTNGVPAIDGPSAPAPGITTAPVIAGSTLALVLSSGGSHGVPATPGFQGYFIALCDFRYAHGLAFVTNGHIGTARVAEGYLALVMDAAVPTKASISEALNTSSCLQSM